MGAPLQHLRHTRRPRNPRNIAVERRIRRSKRLHRSIQQPRPLCPAPRQHQVSPDYRQREKPLALRPLEDITTTLAGVAPPACRNQVVRRIRPLSQPRNQVIHGLCRLVAVCAAAIQLAAFISHVDGRNGCFARQQLLSQAHCERVALASCSAAWRTASVMASACSGDRPAADSWRAIVCVSNIAGTLPPRRDRSRRMSYHDHDRPDGATIAAALDLRRRGSEWAGPCPRCDGRDRFHVRADGLFDCRVCGDDRAGLFEAVMRRCGEWDDSAGGDWHLCEGRRHDAASTSASTDPSTPNYHASPRPAEPQAPGTTADRGRQRFPEPHRRDEVDGHQQAEGTASHDQPEHGAEMDASWLVTGQEPAHAMLNIAVWRGAPPLRPPHRDTAVLRRFRPAVDAAGVGSRADWSMTAGLFASARPLETCATPVAALHL